MQGKEILQKLTRIKSELDGIKDKFSEGLNVLKQMIDNKNKLYFEYKSSPGPESKEQLTNLIQNQITLLNYFKSTGLPELIKSLSSMLYDLNLKADKEFSKLMTPLDNALVNAQQKIDGEIHILNQQLLWANSLEKDAAMFERSLEAEKVELEKFFSGFRKVDAKGLKNYVTKIREAAAWMMREHPNIAVPVATFGASALAVGVFTALGLGITSLDHETSMMIFNVFSYIGYTIVALCVGFLGLLMAS